MPAERFDVFKDDGRLVWIDAVPTIEAAKKLARNYPDETRLLVFDQITRSRLYLNELENVDPVDQST